MLVLVHLGRVARDWRTCCHLGSSESAGTLSCNPALGSYQRGARFLHPRYLHRNRVDKTWAFPNSSKTRWLKCQGESLYPTSRIACIELLFWLLSVCVFDLLQFSFCLPCWLFVSLCVWWFCVCVGLLFFLVGCFGHVLRTEMIFFHCIDQKKKLELFKSSRTKPN